jgi:hypothetical protein
LVEGLRFHEYLRHSQPHLVAGVTKSNEAVPPLVSTLPVCNN